MNQLNQHQKANGFPVKNVLLLGLVVLLVITAKLMPYLLPKLGFEIPVDQSWSYFWNFSPLLPLAIVAGATLPRMWAIVLPTLTWLAGDFGIWAITGHREWAFHQIQPIVYLLMWITVLIGEAGGQLSDNKSYLAKTGRNLLAGCVGATLFFLGTNFFVWMTPEAGSSYAPTLGGLLECYTAAIPFYRNSLVGIIVYVPVLTGLMHAVNSASERDSVNEFSVTEKMSPSQND